MTDHFLRQLSSLLPEDQFSTQPDQLKVASRDESSLPGVTPRAVVWAADTEQISEIVKVCAGARVPITTRGAGSALEGSTIPCEGGIVLDLSRMTGILNIWTEDLQARVEPGLVYDHLNDRLKREGLFFPPSPGGSGDIATIGGMVATNASGIYSVKYGGTRNYLLQLEIVTGDGRVMNIGSRAAKRSSGYNLVDLVAGSEGTLAIVSRITLRLAGIPEGRKQVAFVFDDDVAAAGAVSEMIRYGLDLAAVEFLDRAVLQALNQFKNYGLDESPSLFLEFHGPTPTIAGNQELAAEVCSEFGGRPLELSEGRNPWEIRHWATEAVKHREPGKSIIRNDVAFPISKLPEMVGYCHELGRRYHLTTHTFGHVGMGLLHALILADHDDPEMWRIGLRMSDEIIRRSLEIGGTISGEHGIGLGHKELFRQEHGGSVDLMKAIKLQFDPMGILNPGKIF